MRIKTLLAASLMTLVFSSPARAQEGHHAMAAHDHGGSIFHMFQLETDYGGGKNGTVANWDFNGWVGGDTNKLWLKSEGEHRDGRLESAEFWALYSRNISTFWDAQGGIRYDTKPTSTAYLTLGVDGLAPYFFETEAHLFVSNKGDVSARIRTENDLLLTQKVILQPYAEINLFAQDVPEEDIGAGLADGQLGLQTRYEITRKFAPYVDFHYDRKCGETASLARKNGEDAGEFIGAVGVRLMF